MTAFSLLVAAGGLLLFAYTLHRAGLPEIGKGIARLGPGGIVLILALSGGRLVVRTLAWMRCVEGPARLPFRRAFAATVMGEALGNVTPFATLVSEPSKAVFVRDRVPLPAALAAIIVENIVYTATVAGMIGLGAAAFLVSFEMPAVLRAASLAALAGMAAIFALAYWVLVAGARPASRVVEWLRRRGVGGARLAAESERVAGFEQRINRFVGRNRQRLPALALYQTLFHAAGLAEVYVTLRLIAPDAGPTLLAALVLESTGRVINVVFRFVPMRLGVDEAGTALLARALQLGTATGVTLALVRKARVLAWTALGVLLLFARGLSVRRVVREAETLAGEAGTPVE